MTEELKAMATRKREIRYLNVDVIKLNMAGV